MQRFSGWNMYNLEYSKRVTQPYRRTERKQFLGLAENSLWILKLFRIQHSQCTWKMLSVLNWNKHIFSGTKRLNPELIQTYLRGYSSISFTICSVIFRGVVVAESRAVIAYLQNTTASKVKMFPNYPHSIVCCAGDENGCTIFREDIFRGSNSWHSKPLR